MNDSVGNLIIERLRRIEEKLDGEIDRGRETRERLGHLEEGMASLSRRVDRIDDRLDRIERRLELQEVR
jgi:predicted nuclease with TOPRIM domain